MNKDRKAAAPKGLRPPLNEKKGHAKHSSAGPFSHGKKGFELQFHWIFVLIAGALILAFFFSIANKQKDLSQQRLQLTLATDIENIFTGAIVSKGTAQKLPVPPQGIAFECNEGCACEFRIAKAPRQFGDKSMFAPKLLEGQDITVWALEFKLPYRVTNFLFLTNPNIKYYIVHDGQTGTSTSQKLLQQITKNIPPLIQYEKITQTQLTSIKEEDYQHTKFILLDVPPTTLDDSFKRASTSAIKIDQNGIAFYEKDETNFRQVKYLPFIGLPSIYAAIFAEDHTMYECGLKTAFRKLNYISQLYSERATELQAQAETTGKDWCTYTDIIQHLTTQHNNAKELANKLNDAQIKQLSPLMDQLDTANRNYIQQSCPELF